MTDSDGIPEVGMGHPDGPIEPIAPLEQPAPARPPAMLPVQPYAPVPPVQPTAPRASTDSTPPEQPAPPTPGDEPKRQGGCLTIAAIAVGAIMLMAVLVGASGCDGDDEGTTAGNGDTKQVTATDPEPEAFTADEATYVTDVRDSSERLSEALTAIGETATEFPLRWDDKDQSRLEANLAKINREYDEWKKRESPSDRFDRLHALWTGALKSYSRSTDEFAYGVEHRNAAVLDDGADLMDIGADRRDKATAELARLEGLYGE